MDNLDSAVAQMDISLRDRLLTNTCAQASTSYLTIMITISIITIFITIIIITMLITIIITIIISIDIPTCWLRPRSEQYVLRFYNRDSC